MFLASLSLNMEAKASACTEKTQSVTNGWAVLQLLSFDVAVGVRLENKETSVF